MILGTTTSKNGVVIRLTHEQWDHILDARPSMRGYEDDVLDAVADPQLILRAAGGVLVAIASFGRRGFLHVIYKEVTHDDGFIITAYLKDSYNRKQIIWRAEDE